MALGFLEKGIMAKTESNTMILFLVLTVILASMASLTPDAIIGFIIPLLIVAVMGVAGTIKLWAAYLEEF